MPLLHCRVDGLGVGLVNFFCNIQLVYSYNCTVQCISTACICMYTVYLELGVQGRFVFFII